MKGRSRLKYARFVALIEVNLLKLLLKKRVKKKQKSKIDPLEPETEAKGADAPGTTLDPLSKYDRIYQLMVKHHVHPISVHIPNGLLPVSVLFIFLAVIFKFTGLSQAAFYNLIFVVFAMPLVLFSGVIVWQKKYNGAMTTLFLTKMICGGVVSLTAMILVIWSIVDPGVLALTSAHLVAFLFVNIRYAWCGCYSRISRREARVQRLI